MASMRDTTATARTLRAFRNPGAAPDDRFHLTLDGTTILHRDTGAKGDGAFANRGVPAGAQWLDGVPARGNVCYACIRGQAGAEIVAAGHVKPVRETDAMLRRAQGNAPAPRTEAPAPRTQPGAGTLKAAGFPTPPAPAQPAQDADAGIRALLARAERAEAELAALKAALTAYLGTPPAPTAAPAPSFADMLRGGSTPAPSTPAPAPERTADADLDFAIATASTAAQAYRLASGTSSDKNKAAAAAIYRAMTAYGIADKGERRAMFETVWGDMKRLVGKRTAAA